jgi:RimJ/RimL family protein N-acetyltransferase
MVFSQMVRNNYHTCNLDFSIDSKHEGKGLISEAAQSSRSLYIRVSNHFSDNKRAASVLKSLGFAKEGRAKDYIFSMVNGMIKFLIRLLTLIGVSRKVLKS